MFDAPSVCAFCCIASLETAPSRRIADSTKAWLSRLARDDTYESTMFASTRRLKNCLPAPCCLREGRCGTSAHDAPRGGRQDTCDTVAFSLVSSRGGVRRPDTCQSSLSVVERRCGLPLQTCWLFCDRQPSCTKGQRSTFLSRLSSSQQSPFGTQVHCRAPKVS